MFIPAGYDSEDDDEFDYYSGVEETDKHIKEEKLFKPFELTEEQKYDVKKGRIFATASSGDIKTLISFLDEGFDVNARLKDDWTLLLLSTSIGNPDLCLELINRGADVNQTREMMTPLMMACSCPASTSLHSISVQAIDHLLLNKADPTAVNRKRMTALMFAASAGHDRAVHKLLPICNIHATDNQGWTALFWAINDNRVDTVKILLEAGLDSNQYDVRQNKPINYALQNGFDAIADLLPELDNKKQIYAAQQSSHNMEDFKPSERPKFLREVSLMLYGMKCEHLFDVLIKFDIDLFKFLTMNQELLEEYGIILPYQQTRILGNLFLFHKYPYMSKAIAPKHKFEICTTFDISLSIITAIRHFVTMQASLRYLQLNYKESSDDDILKYIKNIKTQTNILRKAVQKLHRRSIIWDKENAPADLITKNTTNSKWFKWTPIFGIISIALFFRFK